MISRREVIASLSALPAWTFLAPGLRSGLQFGPWVALYRIEKDEFFAYPWIGNIDDVPAAYRVLSERMSLQLYRDNAQAVRDFIASGLQLIKMPYVQLPILDFDENDRLLFGFDRLKNA